MQALVDRMLELTKLEQRHAQVERERLLWTGVLTPFEAAAGGRRGPSMSSKS